MAAGILATEIILWFLNYQTKKFSVLLEGSHTLFGL